MKIRHGKVVAGCAAAVIAVEVQTRCENLLPRLLSIQTERRIRSHVADREFQLPVTTQTGVARVVDTRCHVRSGQRLHGGEKLTALARAGEFTAVEQQVGIGAERILPLKNLQRVTGDRLAGEPAGAQLNAGRISV